MQVVIVLETCVGERNFSVIGGGDGCQKLHLGVKLVHPDCFECLSVMLYW
jgi:hypothetical protein